MSIGSWNNAGIEKWVESFISAKNMTGMVSFQIVIEEGTKEIYGIDCKPYLSSTIMEYNNKQQVRNNPLRAFFCAQKCLHKIQ